MLLNMQFDSRMTRRTCDSIQFRSTS